MNGEMTDVNAKTLGQCVRICGDLETESESDVYVSDKIYENS